MLPTGVRNRISLTVVDIKTSTTEIETGLLLYVMLGVANILPFFKTITLYKNKTLPFSWLNYRTINLPCTKKNRKATAEL